MCLILMSALGASRQGEELVITVPSGHSSVSGFLSAPTSRNTCAAPGVYWQSVLAPALFPAPATS